MKKGAVIILYHPQVAHLTSTVNTLSASGWPVVLVDNSPSPLSERWPDNVTYIHFPSNIGIAAAQNRGIDALIAAQCKRILVLDQDSNIIEQMLLQLDESFSQAQQVFQNVAAIGPLIICEFIDAPVQPKFQKVLEQHENLARVKQIIASGMLISADAYADIGAKDENLFIDGVDHEWCWRARDKGYSIVQCTNIPMRHKQGDARHRILGVTFKQGAPIRLYYQVRNVLILSRRRYVPLYWKLRHISALPLRWAVNRWIFPQGKQRGYFIRRGLLDGIRGRSGKFK